MRTADAARLLLLAAIWSASFVLLRVLAPAIGPLWTACGRLLLAGVVLAAWLAVRRTPVRLAARWRAYLLVGVVNCALPFVLFGYAALTLPASCLVILNAATPLFGALVAAATLGERIDWRKGAGLCAGFAGVALVTRSVPLHADAQFAIATVAGLGGALCYALAAVWLKRFGADLAPAGIAAWSQLFAGALLLILAVPSTVPGVFDARAAGALLVLALVCSGIAYLLYYRLIRDIGPTRALMVTFLMPAFGMTWGAVFLGESITAGMVGGAVLIVVGTGAVLGSAVRPREGTDRRRRIAA